jgi:hypothetical protein
MPIRKKMDIGFNRKVQASWLTETLRLTAAGVAVDEIETSLKEQIALENQGKETVRKVFIYLNRVWIQPPDYCTALRDEALEMFRHRPDADSAFLLNWGMCLAAYPFIAHVAEATGRLLRLQGEAHAPQVNVRIRERFGDRHFVHRSIRYNLSTFLESGALQEGKKAGIYLRGRVMKPRDNKEIAWLVEALLHSQDDANFPLQQIVVHGALFPFDMTDLSLTALKESPRLDIFRHGMSETLIGLSMGEVRQSMSLAKNHQQQFD